MNFAKNVPAFAPYQTLIRAIINASHMTEHIRSNQDYGRLIKSDASPVTVADVAAQMAIIRGIRSDFPDETIIAEEDSTSLEDHDFCNEIKRNLALFDIPFDDFKGLINPNSRGAFWTIDPIDGTKGFLRNGQYALCVSRIVDGQVNLSLVACPNLDCSREASRGVLFAAISGQGVYEVSMKSGEALNIEKRNDKLPGSLMAESFEAAHTSHTLSTTFRTHFNLSSEPLRLDSQAKYGMLARGQASIYLRKPKEGYEEKIWDHAPGWLLVVEAGGQVTDFKGNPILFEAKNCISIEKGIVATMYAPEDHARIVEYLESL